MPAVCDCFPELKVVTEAREARYRADPDKRAPEGPQSSLEIKVTSIGNLNERVETRNSGRHFIISEPKHVGGLADAPTPLEYLLSGAVGCYAAVFAFYAANSIFVGDYLTTEGQAAEADWQMLEDMGFAIEECAL